MKYGMTLLVAVFATTVSLFAGAAPPPLTTIVRAEDSQVKELDGIYKKFSAAVRKGDMAAFRALRTAKANAGIPPNATGSQLKGMADMMAPSQAGFKFVRLDIQGDQARQIYKLEKTGELTLRALMFEKEGGRWKSGDVGEGAHIGQVPALDEALKQLLANPTVQFHD